MKDVNFLEILNDYSNKFCKNNCLLTTNYQKEPLKVVFNIFDLFHLFGIHKVTNLTSTEWVKLVKDNKFSLKDYRNIEDVLPRIDSYYFLSEIFFKNNVEVLILGKDIRTNTMRLSIVFYKENYKKQTVVLGLRADKRNNYRPATLHVSRINKYKNYRKTKITNIEWLE